MAAIEVQGAARLARTLAAAADEIRDLTDANRAAGLLIEAGGRAGAPVLTGRLVGSLTTDAGPGQAVIGSNVIYSRVIHEGSARRHISARPFLVDAARAREAGVVNIYATKTVTVLSKVKGI